jgi:hypothetical protein
VSEADTPTAVIVPYRRAPYGLGALAMACAADEIPAVPGTRTSEFWVADVGVFQGEASLLAYGAKELTPGAEAGVTGSTALILHDGRLLAILGSEDDSGPAIWIAVALADVNVSTEGVTGTFKKRPQKILIDYGPDDSGWMLALTRIGKADRTGSSDGTLYPRREAGLAKALGSPSQGRF